VSRLPSILQYDAVTASLTSSAYVPIMQEKSSTHDRNDQTVQRIYIGRRFKNDTERLEKLFDFYTKMTASDVGKVQKAGKKGV
jgi:hypothetical protein